MAWKKKAKKQDRELDIGGSSQSDIKVSGRRAGELRKEDGTFVFYGVEKYMAYSLGHTNPHLTADDLRAIAAEMDFLNRIEASR